MPFTRIWRVYSIEAAHHLPFVPEGHKCGRVHGHNFTIRVELTSAVLKNGWICDFALVDEIVHFIIDDLDHRSLNDTLENPTSENLAHYIWDQLRNCGTWIWFTAEHQALLNNVEWFAVEVSENDSSGARVEAA